jgi:hypothetical protein
MLSLSHLQLPGIKRKPPFERGIRTSLSSNEYPKNLKKNLDRFQFTTLLVYQARPVGQVPRTPPRVASCTGCGHVFSLGIADSVFSEGAFYQTVDQGGRRPAASMNSV